MIRMAKDVSGNRVWIENADSEASVYYCEECGCRLIPKNKGNIKAHHYAHKIDADSTDVQRSCAEYNSVNGMTEWHSSWQEMFPEECREVVFKNETLGMTRRADVYLEKYKTFIEFQESALDEEVFAGRNLFYKSMGLKVVWLFDFNRISNRVDYLFPDEYDDYIERMVRSGESRDKKKRYVYRIDKTTYINTFGYWKPQKQDDVKIHFELCNSKGTAFYRSIVMVSGDLSREYIPTVNLFTIQSVFPNCPGMIK